MLVTLRESTCLHYSTGSSCISVPVRRPRRMSTKPSHLCHQTRMRRNYLVTSSATSSNVQRLSLSRATQVVKRTGGASKITLTMFSATQMDGKDYNKAKCVRLLFVQASHLQLRLAVVGSISLLKAKQAFIFASIVGLHRRLQRF